jgi:chloramphenicol-sensitive protein RarD
VSHAAGASGGQSRRVLAVGIGGYIIWGLIPAWFILAGQMGAGSWEIVAQRALWSAPWAALLVAISGHWDQVRRVFVTPKLLGQLAVSALMLVSGWSVYVWAVNNGHNFESSLGYFINPLMNMAMGAWLFRERIDLGGLAAIGLAVVGVALQTLALGHLPLIALFLATTFTIYGVIRKRIDVDAQAGLLVESLLMFPAGLALALWLGHAGAAKFGTSLPITLVLAFMGPATVLPLALFAWTARRMALSSVAFLQFIGPTIGFLIAIAMGERLNLTGALSFAFIWASVAVFLIGAWRRSRRLEGVPAGPAVQASEA